MPDLQNPSNKGLLQQSVGSLTLRVSYLAISTAVTLLLARALGPQGYGVYSFAVSLVTMASILSFVGLPEFLTRELATLISRGSLSRARQSLDVGTRIVITSSALTAGFLALLVALGVHIGPLDSEILLISALAIPLLALIATYKGALRGAGRVLLAQVPGDLVRPSAFLVLVLFTLVLADRPSASDAMGLYVVSATAGLVVSTVFIKARSGLTLAPRYPERIRWRSLLVRSAPFALLSGAQVFNRHIDVLMVGVLTTATDVGLYRTAVQVSDVVNLPLVAIAAVIAPRLAAAFARDHLQDFRDILTRAHRLGVVGVSLGTVIAILAAEEILGLLFGMPYQSAAIPLVILAIGRVFYSIVAFSGLALAMIGYAGIATVATLATASLNIGLNIVLISEFGIAGAALATAASAAIVASAAMWRLNQIVGRDCSAIGLEY